MEVLKFDNVQAFAKTLSSIADEGLDSGVVASYDLINELLKTLIKFNDKFSCISVELYPENDEYVLEIDDKYGIWITPAIGSDGDYLTLYDDAIFVHSDVNSKLLKKEHSYIVINEFEIASNNEEKTIVKKDENHISQSWNEDGIHFSRNFWSTDTDLVSEILREWINM